MTRSHTTRLVRGARVSVRSPIGQVLERAAQPTEVVDFYDVRSKAYTLAMANIHKPWARRWLNQNGYRWATSIYRERQKRNSSDENQLGEKS